MQTAIIVVLAVAAFALLLRMFSGGPPVTVPAAESSPEDDGSEEGEPEGEPEPEGIVAVTSDGWSFLPDGKAVQLIPPAEAEDPWPVAPGADPSHRSGPVHPRTGGRIENWKPGEHLGPGDFVAARVRRGAPDLDPWRLEALGRDHEHVSWAFETEEAAGAALALLQSRIVRALLDEDGRPFPVGDEDFAVARRKKEETEAELALEPPLEEGNGMTIG